MCFYIDSKYPDKQIAKRDITCYKVLWYNYLSQYRYKRYESDKLYKDKIGNPYYFYGIITIDDGLHSYSSIKKAIRERRTSTMPFIGCTLKDLIIVKCMIPKGSEYYYNSKDREYVSNQIIIKEQIK